MRYVYIPSRLALEGDLPAYKDTADELVRRYEGLHRTLVFVEPHKQYPPAYDCIGNTSDVFLPHKKLCSRIDTREEHLYSKRFRGQYHAEYISLPNILARPGMIHYSDPNVHDCPIPNCVCKCIIESDIPIPFEDLHTIRCYRHVLLFEQNNNKEIDASNCIVRFEKDDRDNCHLHIEYIIKETPVPVIMVPSITYDQPLIVEDVICHDAPVIEEITMHQFEIIDETSTKPDSEESPSQWILVSRTRKGISRYDSPTVFPRLSRMQPAIRVVPTNSGVTSGSCQKKRDTDKIMCKMRKHQ